MGERMMATTHHKAGTARHLRSWVVIAVLVASACGAPAPAAREATEFIIPTPLEIEVTGTKFHWEIHYPGPDGVLGTADDRYGERELHLPVNADARIHLRSKDYVYSFALPHLGLKEIAVPEMEFFLEFVAAQTGTFELRGDQLCGFAHPDLLGTVVVARPADYAAAMARLRSE